MLRHVARNTAVYSGFAAVLMVIATAATVTAVQSLKNMHGSTLNALLTAKGGVALGLLLCVFATVAVLVRARRETGAFYFVQLDTSPHTGRLARASAIARRRGLRFRSFTALVDPPRSGVVDLVDEVGDAVESLREFTNDDDDTAWAEVSMSGIWPAFLAIGYAWPMDDRILLRDGRGARATREGEMAVSRPLRTHPCGGGNQDVRLVLLDVHVSDSVPETGANLVQFATALGEAHCEVVTAGATARGPVVEIDRGADSRRLKIVLGQQKFSAPRALLLKIGTAARRGAIGMTPMDGAALLAESILTAAEKFPSANVVVRAQVSAPVAMMAGRMLADNLDQNPKPPALQHVDLWGRLTLLADAGGREMLPHLVREAQRAW